MALFRTPRSLSWHLVVLVTAAMLPFFLFLAIMVAWLVDAERASSIRRLRWASHEMEKALDLEIDSSIRTLRALAESDDLKNRNLAVFHGEIARVLRTQASWVTLLVHTPDGRLVLDGIRPYPGKLDAPPEPESLVEMFRRGRPRVGRVVERGVKRAKPGERHAFPIRVPVYHKGKIIYALTAIISTGSLDKIVGISSSTDNWTRTLLDASGTVASASQTLHASVGKPTPSSFLQVIEAADEYSVVETDLHSERMYLSFARSPITGWSAIVAAPVSAFNARAWKSLGLVILIGGFLLLVFGTVALLYSRRLAARIQAVTLGATAIPRGEVPRVAPSGVREVDQLRDSLVTTATLLGDREKERDELLARANQARAEAEAASRAKTEFLANMSHELRTPLTVVLGVAELMMLEKAPHADLLNRHGTHLLRLIDDILDLSRVESGRLSIERSDVVLRTVISDALAAVKPSTDERGLDLLVSYDDGVPETVVTDGVRLRQMLYNVLGNAVKFTPRGSVALRISCGEGILRFTITDTGIGIADVQKAGLFEMFTQADSGYTRQYGGAGLGLALSRKLARLLGGDIELIESQSGRGSTFRIQIPCGYSLEKPHPGEYQPACHAPGAALT